MVIEISPFHEFGYVGWEGKQFQGQYFWGSPVGGNHLGRKCNRHTSYFFYSMITALGLPLLMVNGKFQSLGSMTVGDLETFIPFLVKCSVNKAGAQLINGVPEWWTSTIQFKFPLQKPNGLSQIGYRKHLASIVCSCYWYHDAQYLLPFCAKIASSPESVFLQSNEDNTTSIYCVHNTRQVLRFNNENKNYDRKTEKEKPPRQSLLPSPPKKPTIIPDIYLCENCDAEFSSHSDMLKHEKVCHKIVNEANNENINEKGVSNERKDKRYRNYSKPEVDILKCVKPSVDPSVEKNSFFSYMKLQPKGSDKLERLSQVRKNGAVPKWKHWVNADLCLYKNPVVEFSSLFGRKMLGCSAKRDLVSKPSRTLLVNEFYCSTSATARMNREQREPVDFRVTSRRPKKPVWSHQYCFSKQQRRSRYTTLKTGLNEHSRNLLKKCKGVQVVLNRLTIPHWS